MTNTSIRKEKGFVPIPNELAEALCTTRLNGTEFNIIFAIIRFTIGYNQDSAELSVKRIAEKTRIAYDVVAKTIRRLISSGILASYKDSTTTSPKQLGINGDYEGWTHRGNKESNEGLVENDYTGIVEKDYTGIVQKDHTGIVEKYHTGIVEKYHTGIVQNDYPYINNNKNIYKNNNNNNYTRRRYGKYKNVYLTDEEYAELREEYPDLEKVMDELSETLSEGRNCGYHYTALKKAAEKRRSYSSFDVDDFFRVAVEASRRESNKSASEE